MALPRSIRLARRGLVLLESSESSLLRIRAPRAAAAPAVPCAPAVRPFSSYQPLLKKKQQQAPAQNTESKQQPAKKSGTFNGDEPLDMAALKAAFEPIDVHFKEQLQNLVHRGRFNPDVLGQLPVSVKGPEDEEPQIFPLKELAQVVPRSGRIVSLLLNDRAYIKPIMSAVQTNRQFNQQPQRSEDNELELLIKIELERKEDLVRRIKEAGQGWRERVRQVRSKHDKAVKDWKKAGASPDLARKVEQLLQKEQDAKMKEIEQHESKSVKQISS